MRGNPLFYHEKLVERTVQGAHQVKSGLREDMMTNLTQAIGNKRIPKGAFPCLLLA